MIASTTGPKLAAGRPRNPFSSGKHFSPRNAASTSLRLTGSKSGVALNLRDRAGVAAAAERMLRTVADKAPSVRLEQFLLEPMQSPPLAELIVGVKRDPLFGMVLVIGAGGIFVELLKDATPLLLPVSRSDVEAALRGLKSFALLDGFRGRPAANLGPVIDAIMAIARYAGENLETLAELDVNPLMVGENGAIAVDALIVEAAKAG